MLDKSRDSYLRYYQIEGANSVRMHAAEYGHYYRTKYNNESTKHKHKRAVALTSRMLVRLVDAMLRHNQLYTPQPLNETEEVIPALNKARPAKQHHYHQSGSLRSPPSNSGNLIKSSSSSSCFSHGTRALALRHPLFSF